MVKWNNNTNGKGEIMINYISSILKNATSLFIALIGAIFVYWLFSLGQDFYHKQSAKPFEAVKSWPVDLKSDLAINILARTKLVADNLMIAVSVQGYPKYFADPRNRNGSLTFEFY